MSARRIPKAVSIYLADESTDEGGDNTDDGDYDADTENLSGSVGSHVDKLKAMREELTRLRIFIVKGLRGISRSGGELAWEILCGSLGFRAARLNAVPVVLLNENARFVEAWL